jgi:imidazolonepropionase-like amidohydrolase
MIAYRAVAVRALATRYSAQRCWLILLLAKAATAVDGEYNDELFYRALLNSGCCAPDYVLITVVNPKTHAKRTVCTTANLLLGALIREHNLLFEHDAQQRAAEIALRQPNREFTFTDAKAEQNLADYETLEALAEVRRLFATKTDSELLSGKLIESLTIVRRSSKEADARHLAYRDAVAHILLERGIGCTQGDYTDALMPHK